MKAKDTLSTYNHLTNLLSNNSKVYYSRFGDGDFYIMNGRREKMHSWSPELSNELTESLMIEDTLYLRGAMVNYPLEPGMSHGMFAPPTDNSEIVNWLINNQKIKPGTVFESHIMFHYISVFKQELMLDFLNTFIRPRKKLFIGSVPEKSVERLIGNIDYYVYVPPKDAYYNIDEWFPKVLDVIDDVTLCIPAAGMAGRVVQKRLWNLEKNIHSIDIGSVIDAACGIETRTWINRAGNKINNLLCK